MISFSVRAVMLCGLGMAMLHAETATALGTGAFDNGASLRLTGQPGGSLLERLRDLEVALAATRLEIIARDVLIVEMKRQLDDEHARTEALSGKVQFLDHARISLETARQEVGDRGRRIEALELLLAQSELSRLRAERFLFEVSGDLLSLDIGDAGALTAIQGRLRARIATSESSAAMPNTVPSAPAAVLIIQP